MGGRRYSTKRSLLDSDAFVGGALDAMKEIRSKQTTAPANVVSITAVASGGGSGGGSAEASILMKGLPRASHDANSAAELGGARYTDQQLLLGSPLRRHASSSSSSSTHTPTTARSAAKQRLVPTRHEASPRELGLGLCPAGKRYHTEAWPKNPLLLLLDNVLSWSSMFGYCATIYLIPFVAWLAWVTRCWPLAVLPVGLTLSVLLPPEPLLWDWFQATTLVSSWRRYFDFSIACSNNLDANRRYIFAEYPHGVFPVSQLLSRSLVLQVWPDMRVYSIAASVVFRVPVWKHIMSWTGARPATAAMFKQLLQAGSVALVPGGIAEMFITHPHKEVIKVRERKGFVRIAVETGTPIVPVYHFGNSLLFRWVAPRQLESWARKLRIAMGYTYGRWGTPLPNKVPLFMAIGDPIAVQQVAPNDPHFQDAVDCTHRQFEEALVRLYYQHRAQYGWHDRELVVL